MSASPQDMSDMPDGSGYSLSMDPESLAAALQQMGVDPSQLGAPQMAQNAAQAQPASAATHGPGFLDRLGTLPSNPLFQMGVGLMAAGGPSAVPVGLGQALMQGMNAMRQSSNQGTQRNLQQIKLQMALARLRAMQNDAANPNTNPQQ